MRSFIRNLTVTISVLFLVVMCLFINKTNVQAAGWLGIEKIFPLGTAVSGSFKDGDYYGKLTSSSDRSYWHIYKIVIPSNGELLINLESASGAYFNTDYYHYANHDCTYFTIFDSDDLDNYIWNERTCSMDEKYSSARGRYYINTSLTLDGGEYYFAVRSEGLIDSTYYLTLSFKEPYINVTYISLNKDNIKLNIHEQYKLISTVYPDNATDKTLLWGALNPRVATVNSDGVVTAQYAGTTTIGVYTPDGEASATCTVTVVDPRPIEKVKNTKLVIKSIDTSVRSSAILKFNRMAGAGDRYQIAYKTGSGKWKIEEVYYEYPIVEFLKSNKKYSFKVRGYLFVGDKDYYTKWSKVKTAKIK